MVTSAPACTATCANSNEMYPPPTKRIRLGRSAIFKKYSLSWACSDPGISVFRGDAPVASTMFFASRFWPARVTELGPLKVARPWKVLIPAFSNSSTSPSEIPSVKAFFSSCSADQSVCGVLLSPRPSRCLAMALASAFATKYFFG